MAVGKELLIGRTLNTNAHWIGKRLALMGTMIKEMMTIDDDLIEISNALVASLTRDPDFLLVIGGLGPTPDDMTLKGVALGLKRRLNFNRPALKLIREHYASRGLGTLELTPARKKMATIPSGGVPLFNAAGTAPGVRLEYGGTTIYCLPGVPAEMRSIFRRSIEPEVKRTLGSIHRRAVTLKIEGVFESALAPMIKEELEGNPGVYIKSHPRGLREGVSRIELDIVAVNEKGSEADRTAVGISKRMAARVIKEGGVIRSSKGLD
jgi:molybdopterin-biosynthesis enzyme MoeA-like protein